MKAFTKYLYETHKVFEFCIKLANVDPTAETLAKIKSALETYAVESIGKPKRLPIQEHRDFPQCGPCECHIIDVTVRYPVTVEQLLQTVSERAMINRAYLSVRTKNEYEQTEAAESRGKDRTGSVLMDPELESDDSGQAVVGQVRKDSMLKELETRKYEFAAKSEADGRTLNDEPPGTSSPVGSRQNKIPSPVKGKN